ncbi:MAG: hypothetical protein Q9228_003531 [Teloschistes exilis]
MADGPPDLDDSLLSSLTSPQHSAHTHNPTSPTASDDDSDDTPLNYAHLTHTHAQNSSALPRRGIKDFESHGTNAQRSVLENSRGAMHDALSVGRVHAGKGGLVGWFDVERGDDGIRGEGPQERQWGSDGERRVVIEKPTGQHVRTTGQADREGRLWLLPEEVVYLVERGSLEVRYRIADPMKGVEKEEEGHEETHGQGFDGRQREGAEKEREEREEGDGGGWDGVSLSLQACYAHFIGRDGLTLERYTVYAGLRRSGYIVLRAPEWYGHPPPPSSNHPPNPEKGPGFWYWLYSTLLESAAREPPPLGPLVGTGLYRNYSKTIHPFLLPSSFSLFPSY